MALQDSLMPLVQLFDPFGAKMLRGQCGPGGWGQRNELAPAGDTGCLLSGLAQLDDLDDLALHSLPVGPARVQGLDLDPDAELLLLGQGQDLHLCTVHRRLARTRAAAVERRRFDMLPFHGRARLLGAHIVLLHVLQRLFILLLDLPEAAEVSLDRRIGRKVDIVGCVSPQLA